MLKIFLSIDWRANRDRILGIIAQAISEHKTGQILMVPELASHDMERRLCAVAGDTASLYGEVLSFKRLARCVSDSVRCSQDEYLDNGGRIVAMAATVRNLRSKLKAYASVGTRPEFLESLIQAIDEFKRCCITSGDLLRASKLSEGHFAQKLEELSLLMEGYDSICAQGRKDPRDQMTWLLEKLDDSDFASRHTFYFNGFPDFSRQNMQIVYHILENAPQVYISLNCDKPNSGKMAYENAGNTAQDLIRFAKDHHIPYEIIYVEPYTDSTRELCDALYEGAIQPAADPQFCKLYRCQGLYEECNRAAETVVELVQNGARYRDIRVVYTDSRKYSGLLQATFRRAGIPFYQSGTEVITEKTVIHTVLAAIDAALGGFEQKAMTQYIKSILSPVSDDMANQLENYILLWSIRGAMWIKPWDYHPYGLGKPVTEKTLQHLNQLNDARQRIVDPLLKLKNGFESADTLSQQVTCLYDFLASIRFPEKLERLAQKLDTAGDKRGAQILNQLWDILVIALEQLYDMLGNSCWDGETFTRLFKLLLSQYDVGTIPTVLDAVYVGDLSAMRCTDTDYLILLGASEGNFPSYSSGAGILNDAERKLLQQMDVPVNSGAIDGLQTAFSEIHDVFCGTNRSCYVFCGEQQPSYVFERLKKVYGLSEFTTELLGAAMTDRKDAGAYLVRMGALHQAETLQLQDEYASIANSTKYDFGQIKKENIHKLYGKELTLSATKIDQLAQCRLAYFLRYGLNAKVVEPARINPAEFGTYVHAVLEECGRKVVNLGGFHQIPLQTLLEMAADASARYFAENFSQLESGKLTYFIQKNSRELNMIVEELWQEFQDSSFDAADFEVAFGKGKQMDPVTISGTDMTAYLEGFVDRVDTWSVESGNYFRVVDYKTGKKTFDFCDVHHGIGLQMLLYLFALQDGGEVLIGDDPLPAGVLYFPARVPLLKLDSEPADGMELKERREAWVRNGLLLDQSQVLEAMEHTVPPRRMPYKVNKVGERSGNLAENAQFVLLRNFVFKLLSTMVDDLSSGSVSPNPYTRSAADNACNYCHFASVCREKAEEGRRVYKTETADKFWEDIAKEVPEHG